MNTGGPAFPGTLLDWYAGQEAIGDEELDWPICEHFAGPRPTGNWQTNPVEWREWEARWRAGIKYTRATAMLAEKARREAAVKESSTTHYAGKMVWKQSPNIGGAIVCETQFSDAHADDQNVKAYGGFLVAESVPEEAEALIIRAPQLEAANRELVKALEEIRDILDSTMGASGARDAAYKKARAILAKHKGAA